MALFWNAYNSIIEPLPDKSQWPKVDLPFVLGAPLAKRNLGRYRKLRIKGCLKGGGSKPKDNAKEKATIRGKRGVKNAVSWVMDKLATSASSMVQRRSRKSKCHYFFSIVLHLFFLVKLKYIYLTL